MFEELDSLIGKKQSKDEATGTNGSGKPLKSRTLESVTSIILFVILFAVNLLLSLISVDAQGIHFTVDNIGIKSAMTGIYSVLAVSMSYTIRIYARAKFDDLEETKKLKEQLDTHNTIDRIVAQKYLRRGQLKEYEEAKSDALKEIRKYVKDYEPKPAYHHCWKYSGDINKIIKEYYLIEPANDTVDGLLNPLQVETVRKSGIYWLPEDRKERDKKWLRRKSVKKFLGMFCVIGLAGEVTSTIIMAGDIMSTFIRILATVFTCVYAYIVEFRTCNSNDKERLNKSLSIITDIEHQMETQPLDEKVIPETESPQPSEAIKPEMAVASV